jgi:AraC-like DNA-binding protein
MSGSSAAGSFQRVGFLSGVPELLRKSGANAAEVLAAAGLTEDALDDPESTIPYHVMGLLLQVAAESTGRPNFGLEVGKQVHTGSLGLVGELMRNSPTLRVALRDFAFHQHRNAHGAVAYLLEDEYEAFFGYAIYESNVPGTHHIYDGAAMAAFSLVRELAGKSAVSSLKVCFSRSEPADATSYRQSLGVKLSFNAAHTAVVMPRDMLDQPVAGADAGVRLMCERRIRKRWAHGGPDTETQVRRGLRVGLLQGEVSAIGIASQLGMSRRTMQRRLGAAGSSFQKMLDETRREFVQQLLANTRLSISEVGSIVGYTDPSALTRSFIRWAGVTPSEWRSELQTDGCVVGRQRDSVLTGGTPENRE